MLQQKKKLAKKSWCTDKFNFTQEVFNEHSVHRL